MIKNTLIILFLTSLLSCNSQNKNFTIKTEEEYEIIDGKKQLVSQIIKNLRISDSLPVSILTKTSNFTDDVRLKYLTGLSKESGLQNYLLDSIYYDKSGNDTLIKSFVNVEKEWKLTQITRKKFKKDKQISYFTTERPFNTKKYYKKEVFYSYYENGKLKTETEVKCSEKTVCDSIYKKEYVYDSKNNSKKAVIYFWENKKWNEYKKKNGR